jgi:hypothetical protein
VTTIEVAPATVAAAIGDTTRLAATVKDQNGQAMTGRAVTWSSGSETVATVSTTGLVTAVGGGAATITAALDGKSGAAQVTVRPPVAKVEITPDTATVSIGSTRALQVKLADAQGATLVGPKVTWASLDAAVATVSDGGVVSALTLGAARVVAEAEGKRDTATVRVPALPIEVSLEAGAARNASLGQDGGVITATSSSGVRYSLSIPPGALLEVVTITMTPASRIDHLPTSGGFVAGVDLAPSGLVLAAPATLTIEAAKLPTGSERAIGLHYSDEAGLPAVVPLAVTGSKVTMKVGHFSVPVVASGTGTNLNALLLSTPPTPTEEFFLATLAAELEESAPDGAFLLEVFEDWFDDFVLPRLRAAATELQLVAAVGAFKAWTDRLGEVCPHLPGGCSGPPPLGSRRDQWRSDFAPKVQSILDDNKRLCRDGATAAVRIHALDNAFFWAFIGNRHLVTGTFDGPSFRSGLCATVVGEIDDLPNPLESGDVTTVDATFGLMVNGTPTPANFAVQASASGGSLDRPGGLTALTPKGFYSTQLTPGAGDGLTTVTLNACYRNAFLQSIVDPAGPPDPIFEFLCRTEAISRARIDPGLEWDFDSDFEGWSRSGNVITREAGGRRVVRFAGLALGEARIERVIDLPATATTFEMEISAHDRAAARTRVRVRVRGPSGTATIYEAVRTGAEGRFTWSVQTAPLGLFAGQTVTIFVEQGDVTGEHGQLYLDRIRIH